MAPDLEVQMPKDRTYYLNGYVKIVAASDEEADRLFEQAGLGIGVEPIEGVTLDFQGPWDEIVDAGDQPKCICPADLLARGGFRGGCPRHG
jgi:hypothetical protein